MQDDARLSIETVSAGHLEVGGEIDAHSAEYFGEALRRAEATAGVVTVDMSAVTFMDSSGLRVLLAVAQRAETGGSALRIAQPSRSIVRLLEVSGLVDHFDIVHTDAV